MAEARSDRAHERGLPHAVPQVYALGVNPFPNQKPLVGVVHLPALPGAPNHRESMATIVDGAVRDAMRLAEAGFDAVLIENFGDVPFFRDAVPPETVASMAVIGDAVRRASSLPLGINVLRNDGVSALAIAKATQARFVRVNVLVGARVTDQGIIQSDAARLIRMRTALDARDIALLADVDVKHSAPLAPIPVDDEALEAHERSSADILVVTGARTGASAERDTVLSVKARTGAPVWLGSGVTPESLGSWLEIADGVIVGSTLRANGRAGGPIDAERARRFAAARPRA